MEKPQVVKDREAELLALCNKYPKSIPVKEISEYTDTHIDCLRESIDQGKCRFAVGWKHKNRNSTIPTLAFYNWITMGQNLSS